MLYLPLGDRRGPDLARGRAAFGGRALGWASRRPPPRAARSCCACRRTAAAASARPDRRRAPCSPASWPSACTRPAWTILTEGGHQLQHGGLARARRPAMAASSLWSMARLTPRQRVRRRLAWV